MSSVIIHPILMLEDNYGYLVHDQEQGITAIVDPSEAETALAVLKKRGWRLSYVFNTHHHYDHVGGNIELKRKTGCCVIGSRVDASRIPGIDIQLGQGDVHMVGKVAVRVFEIPGHTRGHIALWLREHDAVFTGDTLFALGCGRVFEGTMGEMWKSLCILRNLPDKTRVYCGHEYTQKNALFATSIDPNNANLRLRAKRVDALRAKGEATIPSTIEEERLANPFFRADDATLQKSIGLEGKSPAEVFCEIRRRKDRF